MRVWLIEPAANGQAEHRLEPILRRLAALPGADLEVAGSSATLGEWSMSSRQGVDAVVFADAASPPEDLQGLASVVVAGDAIVPQWSKHAESAPVVFVPPSADEAELHLALSTLRGACLRERTLREEIRLCRQRLDDRIVIEKAKGVLQQRFHMTEEQAYKQLRLQSRRQRKQIREIAQSLLDAQFLFENNEETSVNSRPLRMRQSDDKPKPS